MKIYESDFTVEFCHCDSAGIVFYPHFYTWFDQSTERMFKSLGFSYTVLRERFDLLGFPLLETGASYKKACKHGDVLRMESQVTECTEKTFMVTHTLYHSDNSIALEGFERRIMAAFDDSAEKGIRSAQIPDEIKRHLTGD